MSNLLKSKFLLGVMTLAIMFVGVVAVSNTASADCSITTTLRMGSTGEQVVCLQTALGGLTADGNFGAKTKAAVMVFQSNEGLTADGVFGPMSNAAWVANQMTGNFPSGCNSAVGYSNTTGLACYNIPSSSPYPAGCTSSSGFSTTTGMSCAGAPSGFSPAGCTSASGYSPVTGGACQLASGLPAGCTSTSGFSPTTGAACNGTVVANNTGLEGSVDTWTEGTADKSSVLEGESNVEIYNVEAKLANQGDVRLERVDVYFGEDNSGPAANTKPWTYFKDVSLTVDGVVVATMPASSSSDWTEYDTGTLATTNQEYRMRFSGFSALMKSGTTAEIGIRVSTANTIDTNDQDAQWQVGVQTDSFKVVDGKLYATSEGVDDEAEFTTGALKKAVLKVYDAATNLDARVVEVDTTEDTDGVEIYKFTIEETNNVKIDKIEELTMTFKSANTAGQTDESLVFKKVYLYDGSTLLGTESVSAGGAVTFDNLNFSVNADSKKDITVKADIEDMTVIATEGTDFFVDVAPNLTKFVDANGNDEGDITETVTHVDVAHEARTTGVQVSFVSATITKTVACSGGCASGEEEQAQATIKFNVKAFGANAYLTNGVDEDGTYTAGSGLTTTTTGAGTSVGSYSVTGNSTTGSPTHILIIDGTTAVVTVVVNVTKTTPAGFVRVALTGVEWNNTDDTVTPVNYTLDLGDYKTADMYLDFTA